MKIKMSKEDLWAGIRERDALIDILRRANKTYSARFQRMHKEPVVAKLTVRGGDCTACGQKVGSLKRMKSK